MGRRGPHPKPAELRPDETPVVLSPVLTVPDVAEPPAHLDDESPAAADVWRELVPALAEAGVVQEADRYGLEALCVAVATMREAQAVISREGLFVESPNGYRIAHPANGIRDKSAAEFRHWAARFGLTPSDRVALGLQVVKGQTAGAQWASKLGANPRTASEA